MCGWSTARQAPHLQLLKPFVQIPHARVQFREGVYPLLIVYAKMVGRETPLFLSALSLLTPGDFRGRLVLFFLRELYETKLISMPDNGSM